MAPSRSDQGARLKKTHQTRTANPPSTPPIIPKATPPGTTIGTTNHTSHCSATASTPGHSRYGFCAVGLSDWAGFRFMPVSPNALFFQTFLPTTRVPGITPERSEEGQLNERYIGQFRYVPVQDRLTGRGCCALRGSVASRNERGDPLADHHRRGVGVGANAVGHD